MNDGEPTYDGEIIPEPEPKVTLEQRLALLNWHPLFTGRCPECEMPLLGKVAGQAWRCEHCGWVEKPES